MKNICQNLPNKKLASKILCFCQGKILSNWDCQLPSEIELLPTNLLRCKICSETNQEPPVVQQHLSLVICKVRSRKDSEPFRKLQDSTWMVVWGALIQQIKIGWQRFPQIWIWMALFLKWQKIQIFAGKWIMACHECFRLLWTLKLIWNRMGPVKQTNKVSITKNITNQSETEKAKKTKWDSLMTVSRVGFLEEQKGYEMVKSLSQTFHQLPFHLKSRQITKGLNLQKLLSKICHRKIKIRLKESCKRKSLEVWKWLKIWEIFDTKDKVIRRVCREIVPRLL